MPLISIVVLILTSAYAAEDTSLTPQQHDCGGLRGDGSCAATTTSVCRGFLWQSKQPNSLVDIYTGGVQNFASAAGRVRRCSKIEGDLVIDHVELASLPFLTEVTVQRGLDAPALCASRLVAQDETPCYCGDATDDCFEHADVIRDLTKYVDEDDDDDEDDVEAIAPAPRQAPPAGWGKLLSA